MLLETGSVGAFDIILYPLEILHFKTRALTQKHASKTFKHRNLVKISKNTNPKLGKYFKSLSKVYLLELSIVKMNPYLKALLNVRSKEIKGACSTLQFNMYSAKYKIMLSAFLSLLNCHDASNFCVVILGSPL